MLSARCWPYGITDVKIYMSLYLHVYMYSIQACCCCFFPICIYCGVSVDFCNPSFYKPACLGASVRKFRENVLCWQIHLFSVDVLSAVYVGVFLRHRCCRCPDWFGTCLQDEFEDGSTTPVRKLPLERSSSLHGPPSAITSKIEDSAFSQMAQVSPPHAKARVFWGIQWII